jgi:hypothetical protein
MIEDTAKGWLTTEMAALIERAGLDSYVAAPLVEATDQWFPDEWHPDEHGVARLAKRVFEHAGLSDVEIATELTKNTGERGIVATQVDANLVRLDVDPEFLTDPLTVIAHLVTLAAVVFRVRHELEDPDHDTERRLIDLTTIYLGFGILTTNAAYRYRASGEMRGNTAITRWSHDVQGALPADLMAYALAMQVVARDSSPAELRAVKRQLETNQADVFEEACRYLKTDYVVLALDLPSRSKWPARREPPAKSKLPRRKQPEIPAAIVKTPTYFGHNKDLPVLRHEQTRTIELGFGMLFVSGMGSIPLLVTGNGAAAAALWVGTTIAGFVGGHRMRRDICVGRGCGAKLAKDVERCPRCAGTIVGRMLAKENLLEAEERLAINQDGHDIDVGSASSVELPVARVHADASISRDARVDGSTDTRVG